MSNPPVPAPRADRPSSKGKTVLILMIIIALGVVVFINYYIAALRQLKEGRLPMQGRVETDLPAWVDQNGVTRHLEQLRGKVFVVAYLYTTCPQGCAGVAEKMNELQKEFAGDPNFHLLSISLDPEHDRPEVMKAWLDHQKLGGDNWWFLTSPDGKGDAIREWMTKTFRIAARKKTEEQLKSNPVDKYEHNLVMVLVDAKGNIRTPTDKDMVYWPFHEAFDYGWYPRPISEDIKKLLDELKQPAS